MDRTAKRLIIAFIFLVLISAVAYGGYSLFHTKSTCTDGIQNQAEQGIDCGPVCGKLCEPAIQSLQVISSALVADGNTGYDFVASVFNPNSLYGAGSLPYEVILFDANHQEISRRQGTSYVLPGQSRFIVEPNVSQVAVASAEISLLQPTWQKVKEFNGVIDFPVKEEHFTYLGNGQTANTYEATVTNRSDFSFDQVDIVVILFGQAGEIVGVNRTSVKTINPQEDRYFKVTWPFVLPDHTRVQIEAVTNVFENSNFLRIHGDSEKFQEFQ